MPADFQFFQSQQAPSPDWGALGQANAERDRDKQASIQALIQLAGMHQQVRIAKDEIQRKIAEDAQQSIMQQQGLDLRKQEIGQQGQHYQAEEANQMLGIQSANENAIAGRQQSAELAGMAESGANRRQQETLTAEQRRQDTALTAENDRAAQAQTAETQRNAQTNDARLAGDVIAADARVGAGVAKGPGKFDPNEPPADPAEFKRWAERKSFDDLAKLEKYKGEGPDPKTVSEHAQRYYGVPSDKPQTPQEIEQRVVVEGTQWANEQHAAGKTPTVAEWDAHDSELRAKYGATPPAQVTPKQRAPGGGPIVKPTAPGADFSSMLPKGTPSGVSVKDLQGGATAKQPTSGAQLISPPSGTSLNAVASRTNERDHALKQLSDIAKQAGPYSDPSFLGSATEKGSRSEQASTVLARLRTAHTQFEQFYGKLTPEEDAKLRKLITMRSQ